MPQLNNSVTQYSVLELGNLFLSVTGGMVFYVGSSSALASLGDVGQGIAGRTYSNVNTALSHCVSGRGDVIYVMPGYTESIATANSWSNLAASDVVIIGMGSGVNRPAFTWTTASSTVLMNQANFRILNCQLFLAGPHVAGSSLTVAAPITISAAGCEISHCRIFWGFNSTQIVNLGITTTAAADDFSFHQNYCYAETAAVPTTAFMQLTGADWMRMYDTKIQGPGAATSTGPLTFLTTASTGIDFRRCTINNQTASSTVAVTGMAGCTGNVFQCGFGIFSGTAPWGSLSGVHTHACYYSVGGGAASVLM